ncbi:MAG: autotransporter outer membrane beta-barrel domain-containing protein [Phascolarctobacterium faecium]|uniref:autotransporter outer membrane beta-barrel domain-containing protein n=1 Tax=Phascolarctobacterium faecium TaxID=33025 RepID=UPI002E777499|nr:autotransporter outer membrane beta-barrel domain-containing protein [Phascolarctobacterium faecium]MED9991003.1 autotransporter outer membrane beta-barrel domain-containing protein [Phascolarctobacterium faecium]
MNRKNLEKVIMLSLVLSSIGSGSAMAWEWGLNNSGGTVDIPESSKSFIVNSMTDKAIGIFNAQSGTLTTNHILLEVRSANKEATGFFNDGGSTYTGKDIYMTVVGGTGDYMVQGIANQSTGADGTSKFAAGDIRMDLTGYGSEIYGIINGSHGTNGNNAVDFKAGDIIIEANNDGNVIGITNKNGTNGGSTFSADNVSIDASGKWFMAGIENQTSNQMDLKNVYINLIKKENGVMYGVLNTGVDFKSERLSILLDNDKGTDKTIGIDVGGYKTIINDDLNLRIIGNANSNVIGVKGEAQVAGNVYADLSGGKNVTGIHGTANIDGSVDMKINSLGSAYGINAGQVTVGHNMNMDITGKDGVVAGISSSDAVTVAGNFNVNIHDTNAPDRMAAVIGTASTGTMINIGGLQNNINVEGSSDFAEGFFSGVKLADDSVTNITLKNTKDSYWQTHGIYDRDDKGFDLGANAVLNVSVEANGVQLGNTGGSEGVFGLLLTNAESTESITQAGSQLNVVVEGAGVSDAGLLGTVGISGSIKAAGDVMVDIKSENGIGLRALSAGDHSKYTGDVIVKTNKGTAVGVVGYNGSNEASIVIDPAAGKKVQLLGDVKHFTKYGTQGALIDISFKTADSFLEGASIGANGTNRVTNLSFDNASVWNMTGDSVVNALVNNNDATIDMTHGADTLTVSDYSGEDGNFIMDTDLNSQLNGDKITIVSAATGTTYVQVKDASLVNGVEVIGNKNLLLITDASENAKFAGKNLNAGGLWDVTPTIKNGLEAVDAAGNSVGSANEWYLTKLEKVINNDTETLLDAADSSYALWRNTNDSLRQRLGDLRYRNDKTDGDGIWARYTGGRFGSGDFAGRYNMYQLGYDKADNAKSTYGFAIDSGTGRSDYSFGSGKDKLWAGSLYGTWYGEGGSYTDVVARVGQFDTDIKSYGDYPDKANAKSHAYSLSVEYGKTIEVNKQAGTFIEPQVQFIAGSLGSSSYTTDRGNNVYLGGINSYIGRIGFIAGQKTPDGNDVYFKANVLKEFGGSNRDIHMLAANGENLSTSKDYADTWFELGLGANIKLGKTSHFYGDIERSFGADIQKKWQVNAGVRFEF